MAKRCPTYSERYNTPEKRAANARQCKKYYEAHKLEHALSAKKYEAEHREELKRTHAEYYQQNKAVIGYKQRKYAAKNRRRIACYKNNWKNARRKSNSNYQLILNLRERVRNAIRKYGNGTKTGRTEKLIGCSIPFLRGWISAQFKEGMSWKNYGQWHIDHIQPCASFDLTDSAQQVICFNYKNLQPLWAAENLSKGDKLPCEKYARFQAIGEN